MAEIDNEHVLLLSRETVGELRVTHSAGGDAPVVHAASELSRYLAALVSVPPLDVVADGQLPPNAIVVGTRDEVDQVIKAVRDLATDGYAIVVGRAGVAIAGANPRGVLYGVYALLHEVGCRWLTPDDDGEVIPTLNAVRLAIGTRVSSPDFRRRGLGEDTRAVPLDDPHWFADLVADTRRLADWMAKNRLSHLTTTATVLAEDPVLQDDLDRRGIVSAYGTGHNIPRLLPRGLFAEHSEYFRMDDSSQRRPDGNLCVSNPDAVAILVSNAVEEGGASVHPIEFYSVQGEDRPEGSWCRCPACRELSPLEQNVLLCRAVAKGLSRAGRTTTRVGLAAYQSTIEPVISRDALPEGFFVHFAPRERSYAGSLTAAANREFAGHLAGWSALLDEDSLAIIEYYADAVRFNSLSVPLTRVIAADLRAYREAGATAWLRVLFMSRYCWWAYPLNLYVVARLAWDADEPVEEIVADFCRHRYGAAAEPMVAFFDRFEQAMAHVVAAGDNDLDVTQLDDVIALGEQALAACHDELTRHRVRRELLAARFAAHQPTDARIDFLRNDPDAPRSAWLDSDLGIDQHPPT